MYLPQYVLTLPLHTVAEHFDVECAAQVTAIYQPDPDPEHPTQVSDD